MTGRAAGSIGFFNKTYAFTYWEEPVIMISVAVILISIYVYFFGWNWPDMGSMK